MKIQSATIIDCKLKLKTTSIPIRSPTCLRPLQTDKTDVLSLEDVVRHTSANNAAPAPLPNPGKLNVQSIALKFS